MRVSVDAIIHYKGGYLFIKRGDKTSRYPGQLALCGGFVEDDETIRQALSREVMEETGLETYNFLYFGCYDEPDRDPGGRTITFVYVIAGIGEAKAGDDAKEVVLLPSSEVPVNELAFDHGRIWEDYIERWGENTTMDVKIGGEGRFKG